MSNLWKRWVVGRNALRVSMTLAVVSFEKKDDRNSTSAYMANMRRPHRSI